MRQVSSLFLVVTSALSLGACQTLTNENGSGEGYLNGSASNGLAVEDTALQDANAAFMNAAVEPDVDHDLSMSRALLKDGVERVQKDSKADDQDKAEDDLWERLRAQFQLDLNKDNARITAQRNWYVRNQRYIDRTAQRASRYLEYIVSELEARDMPGELALLPIVESAFDPFAYSHGRASGLWQFIPSTGRAYGMDQNWWYDGRRDVIASTEGALTYLESLSRRFDDDYELALAAYNAGGGRVNSARRRNANQGQPTDYWSLTLPRETQHYVPKLLALAQVIADPEKYGIELPHLPNAPYFDVVDVGSQIDLAQAAEMAEVDVQEIYLLNPSFNRWATSPEGPHRLLVPYEAGDTLRAALEEIPPEERLSWKDYQIQPGDSLIRIARQFGTSVDAIREHNNIRGNTIRAGQSLLIPVAGRDGEYYPLSETQRAQARQVRQGQNRQKTEHRVRSGDTFWDISRAYGVSVGELAAWNGMAPGDPLRPGMNLVIYQEGGTQTASNQSQRDGMVRRIGYQVRQGDSLSRIANRFNVGVRQITEWNDINSSQYLQPGQNLKLYVDIRTSP